MATTSEIFNLAPSSSACNNLSPTSPSHANSLVGLDYNNTVLLCGAYNCLTNSKGLWVTSSLKGPSQYNTYSHSYAFIPGQNGAGRMVAVTSRDSIEYLTPTGWKLSNAHTPYFLYYPCIAAMNSSVFVISVGWNYSQQTISTKTFYYNVESDTLTDGPERLEPRSTTQCSKIRSSPTESSVMVAGTGTYHYRPNWTTTEYLDAGNQVWKSGPMLPLDISGGFMLEHPRGGVLLIGGLLDGWKSLDTIYHLPSLTSKWELLPQKLKEPRHDFAAVVVPDDVTTCSG